MHGHAFRLSSGLHGALPGSCFSNAAIHLALLWGLLVHVNVIATGKVPSLCDRHQSGCRLRSQRQASTWSGHFSEVECRHLRMQSWEVNRNHETKKTRVNRGNVMSACGKGTRYSQLHELAAMEPCRRPSRGSVAQPFSPSTASPKHRKPTSTGAHISDKTISAWVVTLDRYTQGNQYRQTHPVQLG